MMGPGEYDKDGSISASYGATHYIGLSMADMEALVRERDLEIERLNTEWGACQALLTLAGTERDEARKLAKEMYGQFFRSDLEDGPNLAFWKERFGPWLEDE